MDKSNNYRLFNEVVNNEKTVLYGAWYMCTQVRDEPAEHTAICHIYNTESSKYTIQSIRKGILKIDDRRVKTARELSPVMKAQVKMVKPFSKIAGKSN